MINTKKLTTCSKDISLAGNILKNGGLVAFPTETVYGLGANALNEEAVKKIYEAKGRPNDNPLIVHIANKKDIKPLVKQVTKKAQTLINTFFPGPLTIILPKSEKIGNIVSGNLNTVAVRMPQNEIALQIIKEAGVPVAAPSANTSGLPSPTKAAYVEDDMMGKIDALVYGGDCEFGVESTVLSLASEPPVLLRPGAVTKEQIENIIGRIEISKAVLEEMGENETAESPGMKYKHYAPKAKIILVKGDKETYTRFVNSKKDCHALCFEDDDGVTIKKVTYGKENDDLSQAAELFDALRKLDKIGAKKVYAHMPHKEGVGMAVYNRLVRAAAFRVIDLTKPFVLGITGQTGAGKGYVGKYLSKLGFKVLDCDEYSHKLTKKNAPILKVLVQQFGEEIVENGTLNRALLAKHAFSNNENKKKLENILHPAILQECRNNAKGTFAVLDAPLLFESGAQNDCYKTIAVCAPIDIRKNRIIKRDDLSEKQVDLRIKAQPNEEYYINNSDFTVINDGRDIKSQIDRILEAIL